MAEKFLWGVATSAFQIEGSLLADGAGMSDWYRWTHTPGRIEDGSTAVYHSDPHLGPFHFSRRRRGPRGRSRPR